MCNQEKFLLSSVLDFSSGPVSSPVSGLVSGAVSGLVSGLFLFLFLFLFQLLPCALFSSSVLSVS